MSIGSPVARSSAVVVAATAVVLAPAALLWQRFPDFSVLIGIVATAGLAYAARRLSLTRDDLGLSRETLRRGAVWGGVASAFFVGCALALAVLPLTRQLFLDVRYDQPILDALVAALVIVPLGTVLPEELAFRGVLWGGLCRAGGERWATIGSAVLFGLWHLPGAYLTAGSNTGVVDNVGGGVDASVVSISATFVLTTFAGLVAGELRRRSGSLLPPLAVHWALNGTGTIVSAIAWKLQG